MRGVRTRLSRYVLTEVLGPLGLGLLVYTFILLLRFLFQSAEMIIRRGLPASVVGELLLLTLPNIIVLTLPMSLLFGVLIAAGRLSSDSEMVALRSCGVSLLSLYRPILLLSLLLTGVNTLLMVYALPWGNHALQVLRLRIFTQSVARQVQPRVFYEEWEGKVLYVFEVRPGEKTWRGVFLAEAIPASRDNVITIADEGEVRVDPSGEKVILRLTKAERHKVDLDDPDRREFTRHHRLDLVLKDQFTTEQKAKVSVSKGVRELTLQELDKLSRDPQASAEQHNLAQVEIHKRFTIPAACLVFGLFALPLGINSRRGGRASGFALSLGVIVVYYVLLTNGEEASRYGRLPPWLGMWLPNLVLSVLGLYLLLRRNRDRTLLVPFVDRFLRRRAWGRLGGLRWRGTAQGARRGVEKAAPPTRLRLRLPRLRIPFPNLLDRYVARLFLTIFLLTTVSGLAVFILFDLSENFDEILKNKVGSGVVLSYYKYLSLQMFYEIAPILVLVTTLITFSLLARTSEITACKSLGLSLYRVAVPALAVTAAVSLFAVFLQSWVLPASNAKVAQLKDRIHAREAARTYRRADRQWLFGQGRYIYNYIHYDERNLALQRLQVFDFDERHRLRGRLFAQNATYKGEVWVLSDGWTRDFKGDTAVFERFDQSVVARFPETPDYFESEIRPPEQLRYGELKDYIAELERSGQSVPELKVELYNKVAFPAVSFIMALVGLPFAFRLGRQGALYGIGLSVVLGMVFMMVFAFFSKIGEAGALPPAVAVWSPAAFFALLGGYLFLRVRT